MICLQGKVICGGAVSGTVCVFHRRTAPDRADTPAGQADEPRRLARAVAAVKEELAEWGRQAGSDTARELAEIHGMMLEDEDFSDALQDAVQNKGTTAEAAVAQTQALFSQMLRDTGDAYMAARADDIRDICGRLTAALSEKDAWEAPREPFVLVAGELLPGDWMRVSNEHLQGVVLGSGSVYSHTAILIKERGIPALICENINAAATGMRVLLDADNGTVCFEPDEETAANFGCARQPAAKSKAAVLQALPCKLYVNIGNPREASRELLARCDGIGLFRTEYLYCGRDDLPGEEEQFSVYKEILEKANGKRVTVRTFDIGSDKPVAALPLPKEENPALGVRGLRVYALYPQVIKTQLRALLRAAVFGNLRIMYPMVTAREEMDALNRLLLQTARELQKQDIPYQIPPQGAMIETPAAALLSHKLAETADFFSVGTNDLTQYTLALDRQSGQLDACCDRAQEAVLSLVSMAAQNAHKSGIEIGICGELASEPALAGQWMAMGMDSLSVSPAVINARHTGNTES